MNSVNKDGNQARLNSGVTGKIALQKLSTADNMVRAVMDQEPYIRLMYDSATITHLVGRGARALMINIRELPKPYPGNTASKTL